MPHLLWMADVLRDAGLAVREIPGWQTRGHGAMNAQIAGVLCHHTAGAAIGLYPSERVVVNGRPGLPGPLANLGLDRSGTWIVVAAGQAWHAGTGSAPWCPAGQGNSRLIGVEAESVGTRDDWTTQQRIAYPRGVAALLRYLRLGPERAIGHKEWAPGRKVDPAFWDMGQFRATVAHHLMASSAPVAAPTTAKRDIVLDNMQFIGAGVIRLLCPVGRASALTAKAYLSGACVGPNKASVRGWFQSDTGGIAEFAWDLGHRDGHSDRRYVELPDGTTQINIHYDFPDGGVLLLEALPK